MEKWENILSAEEIRTYQNDGVFVPSFRLPSNKLELLQSLSDDIVSRNPRIGDEPMASPHVPGSGVQNLKSDIRWLELPTFPPILDMVEQLIGPDIILWGTTLFHKPSGIQRTVPWHRDGRY